MLQCAIFAAMVIYIQKLDLYDINYMTGKPTVTVIPDDIDASILKRVTDSYKHFIVTSIILTTWMIKNRYHICRQHKIII